MEPQTDFRKDVHTEHCCANCGCKYGEDEIISPFDGTNIGCSVVSKQKPQSFPCGKTGVCYENRSGEEDASEHDKLSKVVEQSQKCGEFLEWLLERYFLCEVHKDERMPIHIDTQELLGEFFGIDLKKLEEEKMEILAKLRKNNPGFDC